MSERSEPDVYYRCPVQHEQARVQLRIAGRRIPATLCETSIDGFTLTLTAAQAKHVRLGKPWILKTSSERTEVHAEWLFHAPDGTLQLGLRRMRDLTPSEEPRGVVFSSRSLKSQAASAASSEIAFAGLVIFLFLTLSMPGIGDSLGTAPRVRNALTTLWNAMSQLPSLGW